MDIKWLLNSIGQNTLVQLADMPRHKWKKFLENELFTRKGITKNYTDATVYNKHHNMDLITIRGLLKEALLIVYRDSLHVPMEIRLKAGEIYKNLYSPAVLPPMKLKKSLTKPKKSKKK